MHRLAASALLLSLCACAPQVHVRFVPEGPETQVGETLVGSLDVNPVSVVLAIKNYGAEPTVILWHKSSIVFDGDALEVMRDGGRGLLAARDVTGEDFSPIEPGATFGDTIYPRRSVVFEGDEWTFRSFLPVECGAIRCVFTEGIVGKSLEVNIAVRSQDADRTLKWRFRIESADWSVRGARPD